MYVVSVTIVVLGISFFVFGSVFYQDVDIFFR